MKTKDVICTVLIPALIAFVFIHHFTSAQELTQTVRGTIVDEDSKVPVPGANVVVMETNPIMGSSTDFDGTFRIENVPAGRISLHITCLGYEEKTVSNLLLGTGKEIVLEIEIAESVVQLNEISINSTRHKSEALNEMASVSAKAFTVEETKRFAGSFNDPARMVSAFAGVTGDPEGNNDIVVRGNSPRSIQWRLEGIEIPNPNHFADEGTTGGPINALNSAMLANSDFFSGAFAPEYGNALSGVFDMNLRTGNNEKREYAFSAGVIGTDITLEGPFSSKYNGSYLANYRYSSLAILDKIHIVDFMGVPKYQDGAFKIVLPAGNAGRFSVFGLGGISNIYQEYSEKDDNEIPARNEFGSDLGIAGVNHSFIINEKTYIKSTATLTATRCRWEYQEKDPSGEYKTLSWNDFIKSNTILASTYNRKFSAKNRLQAGGVYTIMNYRMNYKDTDRSTDEMRTIIDKEGNTGFIQCFASLKSRLGENLTVVSGFHYMHFLLNDRNSLEPRLGMTWQFSSMQSINAGFGLHSRIEPASTYLADIVCEDGSIRQANRNLGFSKAAHAVLGYGIQVSENMHIKTEVYYQHLYNIPVSKQSDNYSIINQNGWF
ncbi:MAG: carboxypeptidase-like regulatory domain-containing protein, partial [Bacteroidetes bacterium]|nr:carboxypeptidase-like regulatory domain-containing protein [Bacteroidota bacterium]